MEKAGEEDNLVGEECAKVAEEDENEDEDKVLEEGE